MMYKLSAMVNLFVALIVLLVLVPANGPPMVAQAQPDTIWNVASSLERPQEHTDATLSSLVSTSEQDVGLLGLSSSYPITNTGWTRLTTSPNGDRHPAWSPEGTRIVWTHFANSWNRHIWDMNAADGSDQIQLTFGSVDEFPDYSPDNEWLVFQRYYNDYRADIVVKNLDSGTETAIRTTGYNQHPKWSPDGSRIVFHSANYLEGTYHIYTMTADGSNVTQLTFENWINVTPEWSPDGSRIAFSSDRVGSTRNQVRHIYVMNADGSNVVQLTNGDGRTSQPTWSPNGNYIAFHHQSTSGFAHLFLMCDDGSNLVQLTDSSESETHPAWAPSDGRLAFRASVNGNNDIYVMDLDLGYDTFESFVALGQEGLWLKQGASVLSGDVGANVASDGPYPSDGVEVAVGYDATIIDPTSQVMGDSVKLKDGAQVYDIHYNELDGLGEVLGEHYTPMDLPLVPSFPEVPAFSPGTEDIEVPKKGILVLDTGSYGTLLVRNGATVIFSGGTYNFETWDVRENVDLYFESPAEIRVADKLQIDQGSFLGPAPEAGWLAASDIVVYVTGQNGNTGNLGATPKAAKFGINTTIQANVYAPNGTLWIRQGSDATGAFLGKWVVIGYNVTLTHDAGW